MSEGRKDDKNKLLVSLIPIRPLLLVADVYTRGAKKYGPHNWRQGIKWSRISDALYRHWLAWQAGEKQDSTDGQHHLASVVWCALTLMEYEITHPELNDLPCQQEMLRAILEGNYMPLDSVEIATRKGLEQETQNSQHDKEKTTPVG